MRKIEYSVLQNIAKQIGLECFGTAKARVLGEELEFLDAYESIGAGGNMKYLNEIHRRANPNNILEDCKTIIAFALPYVPRRDLYVYNPLFSVYSQGADYHKVAKKRLKPILKYLESISSEHKSRIVVDTAPILEKSWGKICGIGKIGRNNLLQCKEYGTYFFISLVVSQLDCDKYDSDGFEHESSQDLPQNCLGCMACIEACPNKALSCEGIPRLNASKCMSYLNIEKWCGEEEPIEGGGTSGGGVASGSPSTIDTNNNNTSPIPPKQIYGCDICQKVCKANFKAKALPLEEFIPKSDISSLSSYDIETMSETEFESKFKSSPIKRIGLNALKKNLKG